MTLYLTDNPNIKKIIPGSFLLYQLYDWRVLYDSKNSDIENDYFKIKKSIKNKNIKEPLALNNEIICVIAESNYKFKYELSEKNTIYYLWHDYKKRKEHIFNKKKNKLMFERYLQRSFFSRAIYDKLAAFNMQRIEQFLVYISLYKYKKERLKECDTDFNYIYETDKLINAISYKRNDFWYVIDKLMYHSRKLDIKDPFTGKLSFINKENSLYKIYEEHKEKPISEMTKTYLYILKSLSKIFPYVDILKTIRYMEMNDLIKISSNSVFYELNEEDLDMSYKYLNKNTWAYFYRTKDFKINMFPSLNYISELYFKCPKCNSTELASSPVNFWCSNINCNFRVKRIISPAGVPKNIAEKDLLRILKFGSTIIKNKFGGYNRFFIKESNKYEGSYYLTPKIHSNDINPDKE